MEGEIFYPFDTLAFVVTNELIATSHIAQSVGIGSEFSIEGIVFDFNAYNGYNRKDL